MRKDVESEQSQWSWSWSWSQDDGIGCGILIHDSDCPHAILRSNMFLLDDMTAGWSRDKTWNAARSEET
jgi:hypothetical protein